MSPTQEFPNNQSFPEKFYQDPLGLDRYVVQEKMLVEWQAPNKLTKKRASSEKKHLFILMLLVLLLLILLQEILLAVVLLVLGFLYMILSAVPPAHLLCSVTTIGIKYGERYFFWPDLSQFWIEEKNTGQVLFIRSIFPRIQVWKFIIPDAEEAKIKNAIGTYLLYKKPSQSTLEKVLRSWAEKLPFDINFLEF